MWKTILAVVALVAGADAATSVPLNGKWRLDYFPQPDADFVHMKATSGSIRKRSLNRLLPPGNG